MEWNSIINVNIWYQVTIPINSTSTFLMPPSFIPPSLPHLSSPKALLYDSTSLLFPWQLQFLRFFHFSDECGLDFWRTCHWQLKTWTILLLSELSPYFGLSEELFKRIKKEKWQRFVWAFAITTIFKYIFCFSNLRSLTKLIFGFYFSKTFLL